MSNIIPYNEMEKMALATAKSGLFGLKSQEQALTLMMIAQSEDIHPIRAVMEYDIIGGKPALKATTVLSRFQQSGGTIEWILVDWVVWKNTRPAVITKGSRFGTKEIITIRKDRNR